MWSPCGIGSCRFLRCRLCRRQLSPTFLLIENLVELPVIQSAKTVEPPQLQYFEKVVDVPAAVHRCSSLTMVDVQLLLIVIRAGKGWRGRRELAPRCSATQLGA